MTNDPFADVVGAQQTQPQNTQPQAAANDPFASVVSAPVNQSAPNQDSGGQGWFMDKVDIFNRGFEKQALGGLQGIASLERNTLGKLPLVGDFFTKEANGMDAQIAAANQRGEQQYNNAYSRTPSPVVSALGDIGGAVIASAPAALATTTAGPVGLGKALLQGAATGAQAGATEYANTPNDHLKNGLVGGVFGGVAGGVLNLADNALRSFFTNQGTSSFVKKMFDPENAAITDVAGSIKADLGDQAIPKVSQVAKEGANGLTPGEAVGGVVTRANEGSLRVSDLEKGPVSDMMNASRAKLSTDLNTAIEKMAPDDVAQIKTQAFDAMKKQYVGPDGAISDTPVKVSVRTPLGETVQSVDYVPKVISDNPILTEKYSQLQNPESAMFKDKPQNSVAQLHKVKDLIDSEIEAGNPDKVGHVSNPLSDDRRAALMEANTQLKEVLNQSPEYVAAMKASQQMAIKQNYTNMLQEIQPKPGAHGEVNPNQIFDTVFKDPANQAKFLKDVVTTGGDPEAAQKLIDLADSLRSTPLLKMLQRQNGSKDIVAVYGNEIGYIQRFINKATLEDYRTALLKVTLSGDKWAPDILNVLQGATKQDQQIGLLSLLRKASVDTLDTSVKALPILSRGAQAAAAAGVAQGINPLNKYGVTNGQ